MYKLLLPVITQNGLFRAEGVRRGAFAKNFILQLQKTWRSVLTRQVITNSRAKVICLPLFFFFFTIFCLNFFLFLFFSCWNMSTESLENRLCIDSLHKVPPFPVAGTSKMCISDNRETLSNCDMYHNSVMSL